MGEGWPRCSIYFVQDCSLGRIKTQFGFLLSFQSSGALKQYLDHYFSQRAPSSIFNESNEATIEDAFIGFIDEVKGEIEEWSQSRSGWVMEVFWKRWLMSLYMNHFVEEATCHCQKPAK